MFCLHTFIICQINITTFGTAWLLKYPLNSADCFATLACFALIRGQTLFFTPIITEKLNDLKIASERINSFIRLPIKLDEQQKEKITMSNVSFSWSKNDPFLSSLNRTIELSNQAH